jgi:hypothetical protein
MNGSTENTARNLSDKPGAGERLINLGTARRMVPLVRRVVRDILEAQQLLSRLRPEQEVLDQRRRTLVWNQRWRRYQLREEIAALEQQLQQALAELTVLGVALLDLEEGRVGFPTLVNNRNAYFSWRMGEDSVNHWHFDGETLRRPIPTSWNKSADIQLVKK